MIVAAQTGLSAGEIFTLLGVIVAFQIGLSALIVGVTVPVYSHQLSRMKQKIEGINTSLKSVDRIDQEVALHGYVVRLATSVALELGRVDEIYGAMLSRPLGADEDRIAAQRGQMIREALDRLARLLDELQLIHPDEDLRRSAIENMKNVYADARALDRLSRAAEVKPEAFDLMAAKRILRKDLTSDVQGG